MKLLLLYPFQSLVQFGRVSIFGNKAIDAQS